MKFICVVFIFAVMLISCKKSSTVFSNNLTDSLAVITLKSSVNKNLKGQLVTFSFDSVIADSRCPKNVECIWAGVAIAKFSLKENDNIYPFILSTFSLPGLYNSDTTIAGYKIKFIDLLPYPELNIPPVPLNQIKAKLIITR